MVTLRGFQSQDDMSCFQAGCGSLHFVHGKLMKIVVAPKNIPEPIASMYAILPTVG